MASAAVAAASSLSLACGAWGQWLRGENPTKPEGSNKENEPATKKRKLLRDNKHGCAPGVARSGGSWRFPVLGTSGVLSRNSSSGSGAGGREGTPKKEDTESEIKKPCRKGSGGDDNGGCGEMVIIDEVCRNAALASSSTALAPRTAPAPAQLLLPSSPSHGVTAASSSNIRTGFASFAKAIAKAPPKNKGSSPGHANRMHHGPSASPAQTGKEKVKTRRVRKKQRNKQKSAAGAAGSDGPTGAAPRSAAAGPPAGPARVPLHQQLMMGRKMTHLAGGIEPSLELGENDHEAAYQTSNHNSGGGGAEAVVERHENDHDDDMLFPKQSAKDACRSIMDAIQKCNAFCASLESKKLSGSQEEDAEESISLDHVLSSAPFRSMLQDLLGFSSSSSSSEEASGTGGLEIPLVTKSYEEMFMREPVYEYERECVMGAECECNFVGVKPGDGFVGVEFLLPNESGLDSEQRARQRCVLCHRKQVQSRFYDMVYTGRPCRGVIQRYGNICNQENEYARDVMLICPPNGPVEHMPFPVASHQRNRYTVYVNGGIRYIRQNFMGWKDFCQAPPSSGAP